MPKQPYQLTPAEIELLKRGREDPSLLTRYWFRKPGREDGFVFDHNFEPEGAWQVKVHGASQSLIVIVGGVGTGKTLGIGISQCVWAMLTEDYKFLNVAQKAWQAHIMWEEIMKWASGTAFEKLIEKAIERPYPKITIAFRVGDRTYRSTMEFMSVADDATGIFSWRGDTINIEEAGLIENLEEVVMNLSTRLTGSTPRGRPYLGRLILISNPWETPHLWTLFDLAKDDPENNLSLALSTRHNKNVTEKQITNLIKHIPESERSRFLDGTRPEGKGSFFPKEKVFACEDEDAASVIERYAAEGALYFKVERAYGTGVVEMTTAPAAGVNYLIIGDPGTKNAPSRDSPVITVWKVPEDFPERPMECVSFWWGSGNNAIMPFVQKLLAWSGISRQIDPESGQFGQLIDEISLSEPVFDPIFVGIDSTGTQKNFAELLNLQILDEAVSETEKIAPLGRKIIGLDFSGSKKATYLLSLRLLIENRLMKWPKLLNGVRQQLLNYDPALDRGYFPKRAQDIVANLAMAAFAARILFNVDDTRLVPKTLPAPDQNREKTGRIRRLPDHIRYRHRRRPLLAAV